MLRLRSRIVASSSGIQVRTHKRTYKSESGTLKPRRARRCLFNVPGSEERKINKALTQLQNVDSLVLDLEDGVAISKKEHARELVVKTLLDIEKNPAQELVVRINSYESPFFEGDLKALAPALSKLDAILLPKADSAQQVQDLTKYISSTLKDDIGNTIKILPAIESAKALVTLHDILSASNLVDAVIFGSEDYTADVGATRTKHCTELLYARTAIVTHAAALGLPAIDLVCVDYKDSEQLKHECREGYNLGFAGKQAIHPNQIDVINEMFCPPEKDIAFAKKIIIANEKNQTIGKGAWEIDDKMIDMPMVRWASNTLAKAKISKESVLAESASA